MNNEYYFYNCSEQYIKTISPYLFDEVIDIISSLPKRKTQSEINRDLFWALTEKGWEFDSLPTNLPASPPSDLQVIPRATSEIKQNNNRPLCATSTTLNANWHADFAKSYNDKLVQVEAQFGKVESMFKDFCGFRITTFERRLSLGIEIVLSEPNSYFAHRKDSTSGMAYFDIAKNTLMAIGLSCPIWLIGVKE